MADDSRIQKFQEFLAKDPRDPMLHYGLGNELSVLPPSSVATPRLNASVSWPACVGERHKKAAASRTPSRALKRPSASTPTTLRHTVSWANPWRSWAQGRGPSWANPWRSWAQDEARRAYEDGIAMGLETGDLQTVKEMKVFLRRLGADSEA